MKFDLHIHSRHSFDSLSRVEDIIRQARRVGLDGVAITDHDSFGGSAEAIDIAPADMMIIPGAEYASDQGHLLVYFLKEGLEKGELCRDPRGRFYWQDIVGEAHLQGAVVFLAHPYKPFRDHDPLLLEQIDGLEVYNSRASLCKNTAANGQALQTAVTWQKPFSAGSDAHWLGEIGGACLEYDEKYLSDKGENLTLAMKQALADRRGKVWGKAASRCYEPASQIVKRWLAGDYTDIPRPMAKLALSCTLEVGRKMGLGYRPLEGWLEIGND
ncbi:MAG: PHP domain-containing protein [Deltaproteobacteria bacterium]